MFACSHSFSELPFLHQTSTDYDDLIKDVREFIEYQFSPFSIAEKHYLFNILSSSIDSRFPLSVIHDLIADDGFSFRDLQDVFEVTPMKYIRRLGVTHFYLSFRLHTLYWAILINLESILASHHSEENHHPWIDLTTLLDNQRLITRDVPLIIRALSSNAPSNIEPRLSDNIMQVRITPNKDNYVNLLDIVRIPSPFDHGSSKIVVPKRPYKLHHDRIHCAYSPLVFIPKQLHVGIDSLIVSAIELIALFPSISVFKVHEDGEFLTVANHFDDNTEEYLVELVYTKVRILFSGIIADAKFSIYDSDRYDLVWSTTNGYHLLCKHYHRTHTGKGGPNDCINTIGFLGTKFMF